MTKVQVMTHSDDSL